jgi:electron transfer flavoprotein alpha subunit
MRIVVCIKQVPTADRLQFDSRDLRLVRAGVPNEINPFDRRALAQAIALREQHGGEVIVLTMGPEQAREALYEALASGADRAVHLQGKEFAGSDTLATARALAEACRHIGFDLILCGKYTTDGETAQVPGMVAEILDLPQVSGVTRLETNAKLDRVTVTSEVDDGLDIVEARLPAVLTASERLIKPIKVSPEMLAAAHSRPVEMWGARQLELDPVLLGDAGSPTWVSAVREVVSRRKRVIRSAHEGAEGVVDATVRDLLAEGLFGRWRATASEAPPMAHVARSAERAVWVVAEVHQGTLRPVTFEMLAEARRVAARLGGPVACVLIGHEVAPLASLVARHGAEVVYVADAEPLGEFSLEQHTHVLAAAIRARRPYLVLLASTSSGRDLAPRVAARLEIGLTGDCIGLEVDDQSRIVQLKPAFAGSLIAPILSRTLPVMSTLRPGAVEAWPPDGSHMVEIIHLEVDHLPAKRTRVRDHQPSEYTVLDLERSQVIVGVGMGIGGPQNLPPLDELARVLGAGLGATRKVVDEGWLPRQTQIGLTGHAYGPKLYVAVGISGKPYHLFGLRRAGLILAVNSDPQAPIFADCDYGIVGDWNEVVPLLTARLVRARREAGVA